MNLVDECYLAYIEVPRRIESHRNPARPFDGELADDDLSYYVRTATRVAVIDYALIVRRIARHDT